MDRGEELALDQADGLVTLLAILLPDGRQDGQVGIVENARAESERKTVLLPMCILHTLESQSKLQAFIDRGPFG
jgi:hypothetical protein